MNRDEIIESITEETHWGLKKIKECNLEELRDAADSEGTEWGETVIPLIECYNSLYYADDDIMIALYTTLTEYYVYMFENTELIILPERIVEVCKPAINIREWSH